MFLVLMAKKENPQPLDCYTAMLAFLKINNDHIKKGIDFGDKKVMSEEDIEKFCEEYNSKITPPKSNNIE